MNTTTLFPEYKNAGETIAKGERDFYSEGELAALMSCTANHPHFKFKILKLKDYLLRMHGIDFIRVRDDDLIGYKVATGPESLQQTVPRLHRRVRNAAHRQRAVIETIDRCQLSADDAGTYDRNVIKNGLLLSFLRKTGRALPTGAALRIDVPKVI